MSTHLQVWENYRKFADERGWLVATILKHFTNIEGKRVLDMGCGEGGTSRTFFQMGAKVTAVDSNPDLAQKFKNSGIIFINARDQEKYLKANKFEIVILQDVLEHVPDPEQTIKQMNFCLCPGGWIFISTPNRFSVLNIISDPHWNLPGVAMFPRKAVAFLVHYIFHRDLRERTDWAALLSLRNLKRILDSNHFETVFVNSIVAKVLFQKPEAVVCHPKHIQHVQWLRKNSLDRWINHLVNDRIGIFNWFINPTWYVVGKLGNWVTGKLSNTVIR